MFDVQWFSAYILLGTIVGFFAGLLGLGGGGLMVPILTSAFILQGFPSESVVHIAIATSLFVIISSSLSSLWAHQQNDAVKWPIVWRMLPGLLVGSFGIACILSYLPKAFLGAVFSIFLIAISLQMYFNIIPRSRAKRPTNIVFATAGAVIGGISALVAAGGGSLGMPFLTWSNIKAKKAVATSAAIGLPVAVTGSLGYLLTDTTAMTLPEHTVGFIYLPAALTISVASFITAPIGARLAHKLKGRTIKQVFSVLLFLLSAKMLYTIVS